MNSAGNDNREPSPPKGGWIAQAARYSQIGMIIPASVVAGLLLGAWLDRWLGTKWITVAGVILGSIAGFVQLARVIVASSKDAEKEDGQS